MKGKKTKRVRIKPKLRDAELQPLAKRGPKTPQGIEQCKMNALTHGLTSKVLILPDEDPQEFEKHRSAVVAALKPAESVDTLLADRAAMLWWKLGRVDRYEAAACRMIHDRAEGISVNKMLEGVTPKHVRSMACIPSAANMRLVLRYSASIWRQLEGVLQQLNDRQAKRGEQAAAFLAGMLMSRIYQTDSPAPDIVEGEVVVPATQEQGNDSRAAQ